MNMIEPAAPASSLANRDETHADLQMLLEPLSARAVAFLMAYLLCGTLVGAERISGISKQSHYRWAGRIQDTRGDPAYVRALAAVQEELKDQADALLHDRVTNGLREERRGPDGELLFSRIRHDPSLMKMHLQALNPEKYGREGGGTAQALQVNVILTAE